MWIALPKVVSVQSNRKRLATALVVMRHVIVDAAPSPPGIHQFLVGNRSNFRTFETAGYPKFTRFFTITVSTRSSVSKWYRINVNHGSLLLLHFKTIVFRKPDFRFMRIIFKVGHEMMYFLIRRGFLLR